MSPIDYEMSLLFEKKIALVLLSASEEHALVYNGKIVEIGAKSFLIGEVPPEVLPDFEGIATGIAWDKVEQYYVFQNPEEYNRVVEANISDGESISLRKYITNYFFRKRDQTVQERNRENSTKTK